MLKQRFMPLFMAACLLAITVSASVAQQVVDLTPPTFGDFDPAALTDIDPADVPIVPALTPHARLIFERGQSRDVPRDPHMFSKVGDSMTASPYFLVDFGTDAYDLGAYADLEPAVAFFSTPFEDTIKNAFNRENYANALGFSTASALDSTWAVADVCEPNESPLACEYRTANAAFALIMFGTNDVMTFDEPLFDYFLRQVVLETINADVVPVLYTMPIRPEAPQRSLIFNQIILKIGADYDLPVINLVIALDPLPNDGIDLDDTLHLTHPEAPESAASFTDDSLRTGYTIRNLVTLQTLDTLLTELDLLPGET